jgi:hypothetical protein
MTDISVEDKFLKALSPQDYRIYVSILEGAKLGDSNCIELLKEFDAINDPSRKESFF